VGGGAGGMPAGPIVAAAVRDAEDGVRLDCLAAYLIGDLGGGLSARGRCAASPAAGCAMRGIR